MNLATTISIYAGGPGSGRHPEGDALSLPDPKTAKDSVENIKYIQMQVKEAQAKKEGMMLRVWNGEETDEETKERHVLTDRIDDLRSKLMRLDNLSRRLHRKEGKKYPKEWSGDE